MGDQPLSKVLWGATVRLNLMRAFAAGVFWAPIGLAITISNPTPNQSSLMPLLAPIGIPLCWLVYGLFLSVAAKGIISLLNTFQIPMAEIGIGLILIFFALMFLPGDPILYIIEKQKPGFLPVKEYRFFNFQLTVFVINEG